MSDNLIKANAVYHRFGDIKVLNDIDIVIKRGEFVAIVGPSGCGKTTLLNLFSGYQQPAEGEIIRNGNMRMVYQQDGLFPWLTVIENVALGLRNLSDKKEKARQVREAIELIGLGGFENHYPHQLSGGMKQRVELARALSGESDILLMDEPFSALDYITRLKMRHELARLLAQRPRTVVLVTHDIEEAAQLADRIILLTKRPGRIQDEITIELERPRSLTHSKVTGAVHELLSALNLEAGSISNSENHTFASVSEKTGETDAI